MDKDLQAIKDAWENRPAAGQASSTEAGVGEKDASVYALADKYVKAHADQFKGFDALGMDVIVAALEKARENGDENQEWVFQTWLFHRFEPQNIGGTHTATVRVTNG